MSAILTGLALAPALVLTPALLVCALAPRNAPLRWLAWAGVASIALNTAVPLGLDLAGLPLTAASLATTHAALFIVAAALYAWRVRSHPRDQAPASADLRPLLWSALAFSVLVLPCTHLAGMDTYRWQDLATNVAVEGRIPWLVHVASLFGFTPRACPSAQPLILASVQILASIGVEGGFYVVSLLFGLTGLFGAAALGQRLSGEARASHWFGFLYLFSPVVLRYTHWATGRGLLLALLPLFLLCLLEIPRLSGFAGSLFLALLLALAHKAGLVATLVLPPAMALAWVVPRWRHPAWRALLLLAALAAGWLLTPGSAGALSPGRLIPFAGHIALRLGFLAPLALAGLVSSTAWIERPAWRGMFVAGLVTLPGICAREMYGALLAAPFAAFAASVGAEWFTSRPRAPAWLVRAVVGLTLLAAVAVIVERSRQATPEAVYQAARRLDRLDPRGPYEIVAPGRTRVQMQAYVAGCPRFPPHADAAAARLTLAKPPAHTAGLRATVQAWVNYLRNALVVEGDGADWYARPPRAYYVTVDGTGEVPQGVPLLFRTGPVCVYGPQERPDPPR